MSENWTEYLPSILSIKGIPIFNKEFEQSLAKNSSDGFRISLDDSLNLVSCNKCLKKLLESALVGHLEICTGKPPVKEEFVKPEPVQQPKVIEIPPQPAPAPIIVKKPVKKRKVPTEVATKPKESKKSKTNSIFNLDVQCGVVTETGAKCSRSITCKMHPVTLKRLVLGRSNTYDILFSEYAAKQMQAKKGIVATEKKPVEYFAAESDVLKLLDIIQNNKPRSYLSNQMNFSIATIISNRNKQSLSDAFKLSKDS